MVKFSIDGRPATTEPETEPKENEMNTQTKTQTPAAEMTKLQREALELLAYNRPLHTKITKRTINSLVKKGWATEGPTGGAIWITATGREALGLKAAADPTPAPKPRPRAASNNNDRKSKVPVQCRCGCGEMTGGGNYRPGHDARHVGEIAREIVHHDDADMEAKIEQHFWDTPSLEKKVRAMVLRLESKAASKKAAK